MLCSGNLDWKYLKFFWPLIIRALLEWSAILKGKIYCRSGTAIGTFGVPVIGYCYHTNSMSWYLDLIAGIESMDSRLSSRRD